MAEGCIGCGSVPAQTWLGGQGPLCDGCFDERISAATGWPRLPAPPPPVVVAGPDGCGHRLRIRLWRTPGGISAEAVEQLPGGDGDDGFQVKVFGEHDADPAVLLAELDERVRAEVGRQYLERGHHAGWQVAGLEVAGRVSASADGPPDVVVDGRRLSWEEFGQAVSSLDGWWFRMTFGDEDTPRSQKAVQTVEPASPGTVVPLRPRQ
jgi:hypothetical protein